MIVRRQSLYLLSIWVLAIGFVESNDLLSGNAIRSLDILDNAQTIQSLLLHLDNVLNKYISQQAIIKTGKVQYIIWNKPPTSEKLKKYFERNFQMIQYDESYQDFEDKNFDYTRQTDTLKNGLWEKFIHVQVNNDRITLFLSYQMGTTVDLAKSSQIEEFVTSALTRMFNKIFNPFKSVYNHGMRVISAENNIQYIFVCHENEKGYEETFVPTFEDGLKEQARTDQRKLSSCILKLKRVKSNYFLFGIRLCQVT